MRYLCCVVLFLTPLLWAKDCPKQERNSEALAQTEKSWARALESHDADTLGCILASDFEDYSSSGAVYKRSDVLEHLPQRKPGHNELSDLQPHLMGGEFGYVRGLNTVTAPEGNVVAQLRFTDIFAYREGRWVAIAGHETMVEK